MPPRIEKTPIEKAMEQKESSIKSFQVKKESGMLHMATARDATLLVVAKMQHKDMTDEEIKQDIKKWYCWLRDAIYTAPFI